jgi:23S rRNA pseudouridine1911/1915/1917 synthase
MEPGFAILFEDETALVVAKPAGLLTQAPLGIDSLEYRIKRFLAERDKLTGKVYLGVPHRIDRPVSGAIVFAKTLKAAQRISKQFESRRVEKTYWALVEGTVDPPQGTWTDHLKKIDGEPRTLVTTSDDPAGLNAILHYQTLPLPPIYSPPITLSLLQITLETGRTHQIRVQCASRGHALLGDEMYGSRVPFGPPSNDQRERLIALHARTLRFWHHAAGGYVTVTAPLPDYWPLPQDHLGENRISP